MHIEGQICYFVEKKKVKNIDKRRYTHVIIRRNN